MYGASLASSMRTEERCRQDVGAPALQMKETYHHVGAVHLAAGTDRVPAQRSASTIGGHGHVVSLFGRTVDDFETQVL